MSEFPESPGTVGAFPHFGVHTSTVRSPINPLDKSTVVSIYPREVFETKPTINPGKFMLKPGSLEKPSILIVGSSSWWKVFSEDNQTIEIPHYSTHVAASIVTDYVNGMLEFNPDRMPGLFFVPGCRFDDKGNPHYPSTLLWIKTEHKGLLEEANRKQRNWYLSLVRLADALWASSNGNPRTIDDLARLAASELNLKDKPWMQDFKAFEMKNCPMCGELYNPAFPMCRNCKTVLDPKKVAELGLKVVA